MVRRWVLLAVVIAQTVVTMPLASGEPTRMVSQHIPGTSNMVVVAEGELEPRGVGSYSVRVYGGSDPRFPYDDFIAGTIRARDGTIDRVFFTDLDGHGSPEIVVVLRAAGTGGYLSADAFRVHGSTLSLIDSVSGLAKDADPVRALEARSPGRAFPGGAPATGRADR